MIMSMCEYTPARRNTMATKTKAAPAKASKAPAKAEKEKEEWEYTVADLADELGIEAASVRVKLRNANVEREGRSYGWNTKKEFDAVLKQLSAKAEKADKDEKPAPKAKGKAAAAPAAKAKRTRAEASA